MEKRRGRKSASLENQNLHQSTQGGDGGAREANNQTKRSRQASRLRGKEKRQPLGEGKGTGTLSDTSDDYTEAGRQ